MTTCNDAEDIRLHCDANGYIAGNVYVSVDATSETNRETFLGLLSDRLIGSGSLMDLSSQQISIEEDSMIMFEVTGYPPTGIETQHG